MLTAGQVIDFHLLDKEQITDMNLSYLEHDGPTDVITFSYLDDECMTTDQDERTVGEIFIYPLIALEASETYRQSLDSELILYFIHGLLHLSGLDDHTDAQQQEMRHAEAEVMETVYSDIQHAPIFKLAI